MRVAQFLWIWDSSHFSPRTLTFRSPGQLSGRWSHLWICLQWRQWERVQVHWCCHPGRLAAAARVPLGGQAIPRRTEAPVGSTEGCSRPGPQGRPGRSHLRLPENPTEDVCASLSAEHCILCSLMLRATHPWAPRCQHVLLSRQTLEMARAHLVLVLPCLALAPGGGPCTHSCGGIIAPEPCQWTELRNVCPLKDP